jgi:HTH-type transcriptional regulator/antitoxin HigA
MNLRIIRSTEDYQQAVNKVSELVMQDPVLDTAEGEQLELLALLIEDYEKKHFNFDVPDPVSAIEFRMEEQGLRQRDLIPILGSRSRVSEVLSRKRPLSLQMIRSLSESLAIPTEILIRPIPSQSSDPTEELLDWKKYPFKEMQRRGWIPQGSETSPEALVRSFLSHSGADIAGVPMFRRRLRGLGIEEVEDRATYSAVAWIARVLQRTMDRILPPFALSTLNNEFVRTLVSFSVLEDGPVKAVNALEAAGVHVVVEPHLPGTLIDGAALLNKKGSPVIGLTLRYDRVDYFWFTLLHELAHVWKHLNSANESFIDRIDADETKERAEKEANRIARDGLISRSDWTRSAARLSPSPLTITQFAKEIGVHPAIVAGRVRHESGDYRKFEKLLGQGAIRRLFNL